MATLPSCPEATSQHVSHWANMQTVGDFKVSTSHTRQGRFGKIRNALPVDSTRKKMYVVKDIAVDEIIGDEPAYDRIKADIALLTARQHPNVTRTIDAIDHGSRIFIVLESHEGMTLQKYVDKNGPLSESIARTIFHQLISAATYCVSHDVAHRICSNNISVIAEEGSLRLVVDDLDVSEHCMSTVNPEMIPPESIRRDAMVNNRHALAWRCGSCLFFAVAGYWPHQSESRRVYMEKIASERLEVPSNLSEALRKLLIGLLEKNPIFRSTLNDVPTQQWFNQHLLWSDDDSLFRGDISLASGSILHLDEQLTSRKQYHRIAEGGTYDHVVDGIDYNSVADSPYCKEGFREGLEQQTQTSPLVRVGRQLENFSQTVSPRRDGLPPDQGNAGDETGAGSHAGGGEETSGKTGTDYIWTSRESEVDAFHIVPEEHESRQEILRRVMQGRSLDVSSKSLETKRPDEAEALRLDRGSRRSVHWAEFEETIENSRGPKLGRASRRVEHLERPGSGSTNLRLNRLTRSKAAAQTSSIHSAQGESLTGAGDGSGGGDATSWSGAGVETGDRVPREPAVLRRRSQTQGNGDVRMHPARTMRWGRLPAAAMRWVRKTVGSAAPERTQQARPESRVPTRGTASFSYSGSSKAV